MYTNYLKQDIPNDTKWLRETPETPDGENDIPGASTSKGMHMDSPIWMQQAVL